MSSVIILLTLPSTLSSFSPLLFFPSPAFCLHPLLFFSISSYSPLGLLLLLFLSFPLHFPFSVALHLFTLQECFLLAYFWTTWVSKAVGTNLSASYDDNRSDFLCGSAFRKCQLASSPSVCSIAQRNRIETYFPQASLS